MNLRREVLRQTRSAESASTPLGSYRNGVRCENLEKMTFGDESFDLVITQDVFEHVLNPAQAFGEIARILRPGGAHVFTVPYYYWKRTLIRALESSGGIEYLEPPDYHGNPIDEKGSLVVTEWGPELVDFIYMHSGLTTTIYNIHDVRMGLEAAFLDAFVSVKKR
jgi:SAM-dependent methyltransferase